MPAKTFFASPERLPAEKLYKYYEILKSLENIEEILNALPYIATILNIHRQVLYANEPFLNTLGIDNIETIIGQRPGELFSCIHSAKMKAGCGTSENCQHCGCAIAVVESQKTGHQVSRECRVTTKNNNVTKNYDLYVTATPFKIKEEDYTILSINDISDEKRRKILERIFFHDIINTAGGLNGFIDFLTECEDPEKLKKFLARAKSLSNNLLEEILEQKDIIAAENNELVAKKKVVNTRNILEETILQIEHHKAAKNKEIKLASKTQDVELETDEVLLKRVLLNMLKNALEASLESAVVTIGCCIENEKVSFWVHNDGYMPREVQLQLFQRSFSTKGLGRGIGTYSMKLLTEKYLKGEISYTTLETTGTTFKISLPQKMR